jgi:hypothetical protein
MDKLLPSLPSDQRALAIHEASSSSVQFQSINADVPQILAIQQSEIEYQLLDVYKKRSRLPRCWI